MNFMKRAWKGTKVKWECSSLLSAVSTAILILVLTGLTIRSAVEEVANQTQKEVGVTVILSTSWETSFKKQEQIPSNNSTAEERPDPDSFSLTPVPLADVEGITKLDNVKSYSFESSTSAMTKEGIIAITSSDSGGDSSETTDTGGGPTGGMGEDP